jgi:hypothetical protein
VPSLLALLTLTFLAQEHPDANDIVKRFIAADKQNGEQARQYTYVQRADHFEFDKGQPKKVGSETREIIFVEGETFEKLVSRNDKPLGAKEQAKEDKRQQQVAEERRNQRRNGVFNRTVHIGTYEDLLTMFDNASVPDEEIRGRKAWVILCKPKEGYAPANRHEKEVRSFERKFWVDQESGQVLKYLYTVVGPNPALLPGSTISGEFDKINGSVWLPVSNVIDGRMQIAKFIKPAVRTEYHNSSFQKFDVQSTITIDPIK